MKYAFKNWIYWAILMGIVQLILWPLGLNNINVWFVTVLGFALKDVLGKKLK